MSDAQLIAATLDGDQGAFGNLVERYQDRLFNTLVRVLGSRDDASDAMQDAFVQAFAKLSSFRGEAKFYTWLYRVAMNQAFSRRRRSKRGGGTVSVDQLREQLGEEPQDQQLSPTEAALQSERALQVQAALLQLSDEHRQILVLREMEDHAYEEIAEMLELPVGTVRSRLFRARMQLKEALQTVLGEEVTKATEG